MCDDAVLELNDVTRRIDGSEILRDLTWTVRAGEHWVVLGPNGSGKTTAARIASLRLHPTTGSVRVLGVELGRADIRPLLGRVGYAAAALADQLRPTISASDVVMTAKNGALETWWHDYDEADRTTALESLARVGVEHLADHAFGTCSSGEKQRVLIARALACKPEILLLDEPTANIDLSVEARLLETLEQLRERMSIIMVSHDLDLISHITNDYVLCVHHHVHRHAVADLTGDVIREIYSSERRVEHERKTLHRQGDHSHCEHS